MDESAVDPDLAAAKGRNHPREKCVLHDLNPGVERLGVVAIKDGHRLLRNDRSVIHLFVDEVDGDPGQCDTVLQCLLDCMRSGERRKQCRMHIDDRVGKPLDRRWGEDTHEAGKDDRGGAEVEGNVAYFSGEGLARCRFCPIDDDDRDSSSLRTLESRRLGPVRDNDGDSASEAVRSRCVDQCLKIGSTSRYENGDGSR